MKHDSQPHDSSWGHVALMAIFIVATLAFLYDTLRQSRQLENIIVVLPVSVIVLLLCAYQLFKAFRNRPVRAGDRAIDTRQEADTGARKGLSASARIGLLMTLLGLYVLGLIYFLFDVSTFLFMWLALLVQGERRYVFSFVYSLLLSLFVIWSLTRMMPFPVETLLF